MPTLEWSVANQIVVGPMPANCSFFRESYAVALQAKANVPYKCKCF